MKKINELTTQQLVNSALATAIGLMLLWSFSITISILTTIKLFAELTWGL